MKDHSGLNVGTVKDNASLSFKNGGGVPSGFVLKLYQMVNGASDEVISWLPSGDAFRISDLSRLESETLQTFFRHKRFQSLVRQLNFYNFRKVNRERTFWVYRHPLFHRDRPEELHLLRRRTCPGVDGRKQRSDLDADCLDEGNPSPQRKLLRENTQDDYSDGSQGGITEDVSIQKRTMLERKVSDLSQKSGVMINDALFDSNVRKNLINEGDDFTKNIGGNGNTTLTSNKLGQSPVLVNDDQEQSIMHPNILFRDDGCHGSLEDLSTKSTCNTVPISNGNLLKVEEEEESTSDKSSRSERMEQSLLVSKVTRQLEAHAKRAAAVAALNYPRGGGRRRVETVTPSFSFSNDTMKYNALTYDDEYEINESDKIDEAVSVRSKSTSGTILVTDEDDSEDSGSTHSKEDTSNVSSDQLSFDSSATSMKAFITPPVEDTDLISEVVRKLHNWVGINSFASSNDGQLAAAIAGFCMSTAPQDPLLGEKALKLMIACDTLAQEFRRYKVALLPNSASSDFLSKVDSCNESMVKHIFESENGGRDTVRIFRVFLLNSLDDLVRDSNLVDSVHFSRTEADTLHECVKVWFAGVKASE